MVGTKPPVLPCTGNTYAPEGDVLDNTGERIEQPGELPCLLQMAACSSLCNDSTLYYAPDKVSLLAQSGSAAQGFGQAGAYQRIGESTEIALRVLAEKVSGSCVFRVKIPALAVCGCAIPVGNQFAGSQERCTLVWCNKFHQFLQLQIL